ncbi:acyl-CoA dehydrogenase, C-terminal domain protein [Mycobacterium xenopi 4042]|uniref:Acyl-CoA dehydrogenase, C-terminal domain protein n=1 Tax=Mycobacterium xenopi 4042 TaxID=1299334 RepID=X7ZYJ5_MYCXE|nr:acyl-CoA dehydrogenase, C-terminal domain protein [Mycobacterium xenopi 4042]
MGAARRAVASELVGNGCAMLNIAVDHVRNRKQFGRAIGANQTPRHRLAQCYTRLAGRARWSMPHGKAGRHGMPG